jgi:hypothetical protein
VPAPVLPLSFIIYNALFQPGDGWVIAGVVLSVCFQARHAREQALIASFAARSFAFFGKVLKSNEQLVLNYLAAFLDCRVFFEAMLNAAQPIIAKCLEHQGLHVQTVVNSVSIIRWLIAILETNQSTQRIVSEVVRQTHSEQLMLLVAPIRKGQPVLFPDAVAPAELVPQASQTASY